MHEARHTYASLMIAADVNAKALFDVRGPREHLHTLDRYGHLMPGNEARGCQRAALVSSSGAGLVAFSAHWSASSSKTGTVPAVAKPADIPTGAAPSNDGAQVALLLDIAKDQVAEAFNVAQALETKARSLLQVSTVFFAASQAAVGVQVAVKAGETRPTWVALVATLIGLSGLVGIALAAVRTVKLQEAQDQLAVDVDTLSTRLIDYAERDDPRVSRFMLKELAGIAKGRRDKNKVKISALDKVQCWAYVAIGASTCALLFSLVTSYAYR